MLIKSLTNSFFCRSNLPNQNQSDIFCWLIQILFLFVSFFPYFSFSFFFIIFIFFVFSLFLSFSFSFKLFSTAKIAMIAKALSWKIGKFNTLCLSFFKFHIDYWKKTTIDIGISINITIHEWFCCNFHQQDHLMDHWRSGGVTRETLSRKL